MMLPVALAMLGACGLILLIIGLRGRAVDDHPVCRKCKFDLVGVHGADAARPAAMCPECGAELAGRRAIMVGRRRRLRARVAIGAVILLASLSFSVYERWRWARFFDWNTIKPASMLAQEAQGLDVPAGHRAVAELKKRLDGGRLEPVRVQALLEYALAAQKADMPVWESWADFFSTAWEQGLVEEDMLKRYLRQGVRVTFRCPPSVTQGELLKLEPGIDYGNFGENPPGLVARLDELRVRSAGQELPTCGLGDPDYRFSCVLEYGSGTAGWPYLTALGFEPGPRHLEITQRYGLYELTEEGNVAGGEPFIVIEQKSEADVDVLEHPSVRLVTEVGERARADIERELRSQIQVTITEGGANEGRVYSYVMIKTAPGPIDFAFGVRVVRAGQDRYGFDDLVIANSGRADAPTDMPRGIGFPARVAGGEVVEVILTPAPKAAARFGLSRIWGGEIVVRATVVRPGVAK